ASCVVYAGAGGSCIDDQVTCSSDPGGTQPVPCPGPPTGSTIDVQTSFTTTQSITNPGYLTTPINQNQWQNIFTEYYNVGPISCVRGKTTGFSEFIAVNLGAANSQGRTQANVLSPQLPATFAQGSNISVQVQVTSVATGKPVTYGKVYISAVELADGNGNPVGVV